MKSILIIEDDEILNAGLCYNLNLEGYEAVSAYNIATAKTKFPKQEWILCILDVNLPDGDGIDYGKVIRNQQREPGENLLI